MGDNDTLLIVGLGAAAIFMLSKPIGNILNPVGQALQTTADIYSGTANAVNTGLHSLGKGLAADGTGYDQGVNSEKPIKANLLPNSPFNVSSGSSRDVKTSYVKLPITTTPTNTIYTNPKNLVQQSLNVTSAQSMINMAMNPNIQNIATNVGNATIIQPKLVSLAPSKLSLALG